MKHAKIRIYAFLYICIFACSIARAQHHVVLRFSTVAPDGTSWARELRAFSREVADASQGEVELKWFFGGIAGNDVEALARVRSNQLDGIGSGGVLCEKIAPSFAALRLPGVFHDRAEVRHVAGQLRSLFEDEFAKAGLVYLGHAVLGPNLLFSRRPLRSVADIKREKLWAWDIDTTTVRPLTELGLNLVPATTEQAATLYAEGRTDGFVAMPAAMLAYQWSAQVKFVTDLPTNYMVSCVTLTDRALAKLSVEQQQTLRAAVAKLSLRLEAIGEDTDRRLLAGAFGRQGLQPIAASAAFRNEFWSSAGAAADRLGDKLVPGALRKRVLELLQSRRNVQ
jgi:TRAP-type C4-dicarboxylate transport system substrate-binding protein